MSDLGVPLALLSAVAYNSGLVLEKRGLEQLPEIDVRRVLAMARIVLSAPVWIAGFTLMLCGLAFQVLALTLAPVTVVQPVLASGVAIVIILSRVFLREQLGSGEYWCVAVLAVAVVLLALSGGGASEVRHQVSGMAMALIAIPSCLAGLVIAGSGLRAGSRKHRSQVLGVSFGIGTGLLYGVAALGIKGLSGRLAGEHNITAIAVAVLTSPYLYVLIGCSAAGMLLFQTALQRCRVSIVAPVSNLVGSVYFIAAGTWLFHEPLPADPVRLALRTIGILGAVSVVVVLSRQPAAEVLRTAPSQGS